MNNLLKISFFLLACIFSTTSFSQVYNYEDGETPMSPDSIKGLYFGLNLGFYFPNKAAATLYNGYGYSRSGEQNNFQDSWLNQAIGSGASIIERNNVAAAIAEESGYPVTADDYLFSESDMPYRMDYTPSFMYGLHLRYHFNADFAAFLEINGTRPTTVGEFTVHLTNVVTSQPGEYVRSYQIRGEEQRLIFNLGIHKDLGRKEKLKPYFEIGANSTFTKFEENIIKIGNYTRDLSVFLNQYNQYQTSARNLTGIGFGG